MIGCYAIYRVATTLKIYSHDSDSPVFTTDYHHSFFVGCFVDPAPVSIPFSFAEYERRYISHVLVNHTVRRMCLLKRLNSTASFECRPIICTTILNPTRDINDIFQVVRPDAQSTNTCRLPRKVMTFKEVM